MNKLKENPFWAALGALGAGLVIFFALFVWPAWSAIDEARIGGEVTGIAGYIGDAEGNPAHEAFSTPQGVRSQQDIDTLRGRRGRYDEDFGTFVKQYTEVDESFEKLFVTDLKDFSTKYNTERAALEKELEARQIALGAGEQASANPFGAAPTESNASPLNWENLNWTQIRESDRPKLAAEIQKRFWIRRRVVDAVFALPPPQNARVERIIDISFLKPPPTGTEVAAANTGSDYLSLLEVASGQDPEFKLHGELGNTLTFGVTLKMRYSAVPALLRELLRLEGGHKAKMCINLAAMDLSVEEQNPDVVTVKYDPNNPGAQEAAVQKTERELEQQPAWVKARFVCRVIDFDATKVKKP